jgi:hypothetical protein
MNTSPLFQAASPQDRFGMRVARRLNADGVTELPHDVTERLRAARVRALERRKVPQVRTATTVNVSGSSASLTFGDEGLNLWSRLASALPLLALLAGLVVISQLHVESRAHELAEVDAALLTDDLPPAAYTDPGFVQYLKFASRSPTLEP